MRRLVDDLLVLSRVESPGPGRTITDFDGAVLLDEVAEGARLAEWTRQVGLRVPGPLPLRGDRDALGRAFRNLVDNALQYSPPDTPVEIEARLEGSRVEVRVRDHGPGLAAEDLPRVFERFYRADPSRTRRTGGSGLGLAIVRAVVEHHGGRALLENHPAGGAQALVILPTSPSGTLQETRPSPSASRPTMKGQD